jgi:hypothetical protein
MDALRQGHKIRIERTDYNTGMRGCRVMQANEVTSIEGHYNPLFGHCKRQHILIRNRLPSPAALGGRQHIMAQVAQGFHRWERKVLIGIAPRHLSRRFIGEDLLLDLFLVCTGIGPRIGKILGPQCGIASQEVGFTGTQAPSLNQDPHGNTRADDTRLPSTNAWGTLNPGKCLPKVTGDPLQHLRFFCAREGEEEFLNLLQGRHDSVSIPQF